MTVRVVTGTIILAATMMIVAFIMVNEPNRMTDFESGYKGRSVEAGAALYDTNCKGCHGVQGEGIEGVGPALNARDLFDGRRLSEIGWAGTAYDYVFSSISGGRPRASSAFSTYPQRMPTWSSDFGGPLRPDQVRNLADFVMNWETTAMAQPAETPTPNPNAAGTDLETELPAGDAARGDKLFNGQEGTYGCFGCHSLAAGEVKVGPSLAGIAGTAASRVEGYAAEKYIRESIVSPSAHLVEGFQDLMPKTFAQSMTKQDLADLIAYLMTK
ncbi:MAG: c-type cytochrome [Chloroflexi bacterium]|nr:c-type cytochrome [Chloroflexota bacterium]